MIVTVAWVASNWPQKATPRCLRVNETIPGACSSAATPVMWRKRRSIPKGLGKLEQDFENYEFFSSSCFSSLCSLSVYTSCTPLRFHPVTKRISRYLQAVTSPKGPWACSPLVPSLTSDWLKWLCPPVGRYYLGKSWKLKTNALECTDDQALEAKRFKSKQFKSVHLQGFLPFAIADFPSLPTSQEQFTEQPPGALQAAVSLLAPMHSWWTNGQYTTSNTYFLAKGRNWRIIKFWHSNYPIPFTFNSDHPCLNQVKPHDLQLPQKFSCICSRTFCSSRFTSAAARYFTSGWKETSSPGIWEVASVPTSREHLECNNV